jgi:hypothetical protein
MITMNTNLDTRVDPQPALLQFLIPGPVPYKIPVTDRLTAHRQTDQRALVEIIQRPCVRAGSAVEICLSVRPSDCPGRFCRRIKTRNRRIRQTDARTDGRTDYVNLYIRLSICSSQDILIIICPPY